MNPKLAQITGGIPDSSALKEQELFYKSLEPAQRLFLLVGPPLSGKSLTGGFVAHTYENLPHCILSDLIRNYLNDEINFVDGPRKQQYESYLRKMNHGTLLSDAFINEFVLSVLKNNPKGIILDGYPRTATQASFLLELTKAWSNKPFVLELDYDYSDPLELNARLTKRTTDATKSGRIRLDDTPEVIQTRLETYSKSTKPVFEILRAFPEIYLDKLEFHLSGRDTVPVKKEVVGKLSKVCNDPKLGYQQKLKS